MLARRAKPRRLADPQHHFGVVAGELVVPGLSPAGGAGFEAAVVLAEGTTFVLGRGCSSRDRYALQGLEGASNAWPAFVPAIGGGTSGVCAVCFEQFFIDRATNLLRMVRIEK